MLATLEAYFHDIVDDELDSGVLVVRGRHRGAHDGVEAVVEVVGEGLELTRRADPDARERRLGPVHMVLVHVWDAKADSLEFELPDTRDGPLLALESPPGVTLRPEDDYTRAGRVITLRRPPPDAVLARVQGSRGRGLLARDRCVATISATVMTAARDRLDAVVGSVCAAMLRASVVMPILEGRAPANSGVTLRLLDARARWVSTTRREQPERALRFASTLVFEVEGVLEQRVVLAASDQPASIRMVVVRDRGAVTEEKKIVQPQPQES